MDDALDGAARRQPGLLVEWRQVPTGWEGRVLYPARPEGGTNGGADRGDWAIVEVWLPAGRLTAL